MNIQKLLVLLLILSAFVYANEGPTGAKAVVSNKNILSGNIVELHIRATGKVALFPAVKKIDGVKVLSRDERVTNMHVYSHGKLQKECTILTLTFAPKKDMTIPSYEIHIDGRTYNTKPIKLHVKDPSTSNTNSASIFSLKLTSNKKSVFIGETCIVTVTLSLKKGLIISNKVQYTRPEFQGFFVEQLDKGKSYYEGEHQVTELKYILTAHSEGNLTLGPAQAKIGLQNRGKEDILKVGLGRKWFKKASNTLGLEVYPQTVKSDLVGDFELDAILDTLKVKANDPVKLTVNIKGKGSLAHFDLSNYEIDNVTVYSEDAKIDIKIVEGQTYSSYTKQFVFVSEESFTIPERFFTVFAPKEKNVTTLKINTYVIKIKTSKTNTMTTNTFVPAQSTKIRIREKIEALFANWWVVILSFVLGGLFFYLLRYLPKRKSLTESEALKILYGQTSTDPEIEEMVRKLYARKHGDSSVKINKKRLKELVESFR